MEQLSIFDILNESESYNEWYNFQKQNKINQYFEKHLGEEVFSLITKELYETFGQEYTKYIRDLHSELNQYLELTEEMFAPGCIGKLTKSEVYPTEYFKIALPKQSSPVFAFGMLPQELLESIKKKFIAYELKKQTELSF